MGGAEPLEGDNSNASQLLLYNGCWRRSDEMPWGIPVKQIWDFANCCMLQTMEFSPFDRPDVCGRLDSWVTGA